MRQLLVLTGVRGAGKTTAVNRLRTCAGIIVLQPTTTRTKRQDKEEEYQFVEHWPESGMAWVISVGKYKYGMRQSEIERITPPMIGLTVFDPGSLDILESYRKRHDGSIVIVGLDTLASLNAQHERVQDDSQRSMLLEAFNEQKNIISKACDIVLSGSQVAIEEQLLTIVGSLSETGNLKGFNGGFDVKN